MEHKEITLEQIEKLLTFIRKNAEDLEDKVDRDSFKEVLGYLETAKPLAENNKYRTCLYDAATKYVNQLAFRLYIEDHLSDEVAKTFRAFETVKTVSEYAQAYTDEDKGRADGISAQQKEYMDEREKFDIFRGIIGGMTKEEAEQKMTAFKQRQAEGLRNAGVQ